MSRARLGLLLVLLVLLGVPAVSRAAGPLDQPGYAKAVTCAACHGASGNSRSEAVPILAGLPPAYFKKAIEDYASGKRLSAEMEPFAKQVKLLGVDEVAAFFAAQRREPTPVPPVNTCYSWVSDREVIAVVNAYKIENGKVVQVEQKLTPGQSTVYAQHAEGWAKSIWADVLGNGGVA